MTGFKNTLKGDELWMRCPTCGDSKKNTYKAHLSVNVRTGLFHCVKCGYGGKLTPGQFLTIAELVDSGSVQELEVLADPLDMQFEIEEGAGSSRRSALDRFHIDLEGEITDVFEMRDPRTGFTTGHYFRSAKGKRFYGDHSINWPGSASGKPLLSSPTRPLRLVEGPYDVLDDRSVCNFGLIHGKSLANLRGHSFILCPDGDVWTDHEKRTTFVALLRRNILGKGNPWPFIVAIEYIPGGQDPDEVPPGDRLRIDRYEIIDFLNQISEALSSN